MSNPPDLPQQRSKADESRLVKLQGFSGPLPHPDILREYEAICPGCADRLIKAFEAEGNHRREIEKSMADSTVESARSQFKEARLGQIFAFLISLAFLTAGSYTATNGHPWIGGIFGTMGLSSIVGAFIAGRSRPPQHDAAGRSRSRGRSDN